MVNTENCIRHRRERGYVEYDEIWKHKLTQEQCLKDLYNDNPCIRSIAVMQLQSYPLKPNLLTLLKLLKREKKLYVRLFLCETLSKVNADEISTLVPYLGVIGHNQLDTLPKRVSKKNQYALPRDLIARTMAHMDVDVCVSLYSNLHNMALSQTREYIDALGFVLFYHPLDEYRMNTIFQAVTLQLDAWDDDILYWKLIQFASSFSCSYEWLQDCAKKNDGLFHDEALRSLSLLKKKHHIKRKQSVLNIA